MESQEQKIENPENTSYLKEAQQDSARSARSIRVGRISPGATAHRRVPTCMCMYILS